MTTDEQWMRRAIALAERGRFSVSPNPMVGCVVVREDRLLGEGFHLRAGLPHAEREALTACSGDPAGATIYVTLEPCAHSGRTPPCVEAILEARPARVVIATRDPNPRVTGGGAEQLRAAGITVEVGLLEAEARRLNEKFFVNCSGARPFILLKCGMSLDARLATQTGQSQWITSPESRQQSLLLREEYDAILVGSGTVLTDDPRLTRRLGLNSSVVPWTRVVLDRRGRLSAHQQIFSDGERTIHFTSRQPVEALAQVEVLPLGGSSAGEDELPGVFRLLYERGIRSVLVEGGSVLFASLIEQQLWDKMVLFVAPMILGGAAAPSLFSGSPVSDLAAAHKLRFDEVKSVGPDLMLSAYPAGQ